MQFASPAYLWLLIPVLGGMIAWYVLKQRNARPAMSVSTIAPLAAIGTPWRAHARHLCFGLRLMAVTALILILARPQIKDSWMKRNIEGTDIILTLDVSNTMNINDIRPSRFDATRQLANEFIANREGDNIGLVLFAEESLTSMPLTVDHTALMNQLMALRIGTIPSGATAIGDGLATSLNRLKEGKAKSKSIILITDGDNNAGIVDPLTAAAIAKDMGVRVYTIGVGTNTTLRAPMQTDLGTMYETVKVVINDELLQNIADETGGQYFRATNNRVLQEVFAEIDRLEKTRMDISQYSHAEDNYMPLAWLAFIFLFAELVIRYTVTRSIP